jgi:amidophosphoribosyltransferase
MPEARDKCGLFGVFGAADAVRQTYTGLFAQQHRGQESAGIVSIQDGKLVYHKGMGLVSDVFTPDKLESLKSHAAVGHVRYSTTGASNPANAQPLVVTSSLCMIAVAHNGNLVNSRSLRQEVEKQGHFFPVFHTTTDTEIILHLVASHRNLDKGLKETMRMIKGSFSLLFLTPTELIAVRDPQGFRPLVLGKKGSAWAVASETCAFDLQKIEYQRDIEPGEIVFIDKNGPRSERFVPKKESHPAHCVFEHVYFARPDSKVHGDLVQEVRHKLGAQLAREHPVDADFVTPIPDSGLYAAQGYAEEAKIPYKMAYVRNHYVGRTFIQPTQDQRSSSVEIKLAVLKDMVKGKRVIVVDDSVIRGTTSRSRIRLLRDAGAKEVHLRVSCPPTKNACYYGIDFPDPKDLIASNHTVEEIRKHIGVDTLGYLSLEGMLSAVSQPADHYCTACWTGKYPVPPIDGMAKEMHEAKK